MILKLLRKVQDMKNFRWKVVQIRKKKKGKQKRAVGLKIW
jgi:hypothetical protein